MPEIDFIKLIREKRKEVGFSQEELAQKAGLTLMTYGRIERGEVQLKLEHIMKILEVLGFDFRKLIELAGQHESGSSKLTVSDCIEKLDYYLRELKKLHGKE